MENVVLNGYEVIPCDYDVFGNTIYAVYAKDEVKPRIITDNISIVWEYCYSQERGN